jgi:dihydrofolate synthase/folylpolyglutamate synthase
MRTLAEWLEFQQRQHPLAIDLRLERVREVAARLGLARPAYPTVLVGGTNGKGSTVALLTALARACGLRAGTYMSPHLVRYSERIRVDGREASEDAILAAFERIERARGGVPLTFFEYGTLAAHELFHAAGVDVGLIEVGLGGRLDATNAFDPDVAVVTSIGLDHMEYLGTTLDAIGVEKAGIFRRGRAAILGSEQMPAGVAAAAEAVGALARRAGVDFGAARGAAAARWTCWGWNWRFEDLPPPALAGEVQYANAAAAVAALQALLDYGLPALDVRLDAGSVAQALARVELPGRFQVVCGEPEWILDVAHNPDAAAILAGNLRARSTAGRTIAVAGVLADKDAEGIAAALSPCIDEWILCSTDGARALSAADLAARLAPHVPAAELCATVVDGCELAARRATPRDRVVVFGSFHTVGPALEWLGL